MIEQAKLDELKTQHGEVFVLQACDEEVVVRRPQRREYKMFRAHTLDDVKQSEAAETLLLKCIVFPDGPAVQTLFDRMPALVDSYASQLLKIAGATKDVEAKKF